MSEFKRPVFDVLNSPDGPAAAHLGTIAMPKEVKEVYHLALPSSLDSGPIDGQLVIAALGGPGASTMVEIEQ